jgi:hypothetical protein
MKTVCAAMTYMCSDNKIWYIHPWKVTDKSCANNKINNKAEPSDQDATLLLCALPAKAPAHRS